MPDRSNEAIDLAQHVIARTRHEGLPPWTCVMLTTSGLGPRRG
jgi:hypothetical protein